MRAVRSFDVFDTLLTRKVARPDSLFLLVGSRAAEAELVHVSPAEFRELRMNAERAVRSYSAANEACFDDIYRILSEKLGISQSSAEGVSKLELEIEAESIVAVPRALELARQARQSSGRLLFASDMYLPAPFIRDQLKRHGFWQEGDALYVSSEWGRSKAEGSLFQTILETEKTKAATVLHTGDRRDADFEVPLKLGIKARHLDVCELSRYEKMLEEFSIESSGFTSLVAGASRLVRLESSAVGVHLKTLTEIASSLISPIVTFYALWLLKEAQRRGLKRLYFVARDGYLVKQIADSLIRVLRMPLETRYLYGSRQAWHLPAITDFSGETLSWLFEKTRTLSLRIVLSRLQIIPESVNEILGQIGWPQSDWEKPLDEDALTRLKSDLLSCSAFRARVSTLIEEKRALALLYFEQEGLYDPIAWGIVDLGWHGRLQQSLEKLLSFGGKTQTAGLYFGLYSDSPALSELETTSYLGWDLRHPPAGKDVPSLVFLMESFCTAPHTSTVGYSRGEDGRIIPQCRDQKGQPLLDWGASVVHSTVGSFAQKLVAFPVGIEIFEWDSRDVLLRILGTFSRNPLPAEAKAWGAFPYEDEQGGAVCEKLTAPYDLTWDNIRIALTFGDDRFLPESWKVLWHGAQQHAQSIGGLIIQFALRVGRAKRRFGQLCRRLV